MGFGRRRRKIDAKSTSKSVHLRVSWYSQNTNILNTLTEIHNIDILTDFDRNQTYDFR